jgi:fructose-specific phosphotransferase system IIC component
MGQSKKIYFFLAGAFFATTFFAGAAFATTFLAGALTAAFTGAFALTATFLTGALATTFLAGFFVAMRGLLAGIKRITQAFIYRIEMIRKKIT